MSKCPSCDHEQSDSELKCPECGSFYLKIYELIAEAEALEQKSSFRGLYNNILTSGNVKHGLKVELKRIIAGLSSKSLFALFMIIAFVFALMISVL